MSKYVEQYSVKNGDVLQTGLILQQVLALHKWTPAEVDEIAKLGRYASVDVGGFTVTHDYTPPKSGEIQVPYSGDSPLRINWIDQDQFMHDGRHRRHFSFTLGSPALYGETPAAQLRKVAADILEKVKA